MEALRSALFATLAIVIIFTSVIVSAQTSTPSAEAPTLNPGDEWVRSNGRTFTVVGKEGDYYTMKVLWNGKESLQWWHQKTLGLRHTQERVIFEPALELFRWPLTVGLKWCYEYAAPVTGPNVMFQRCNEVKTFEEVKVQAGSFQAFRIEAVATHLDRSAPDVYHTYWYAPQARGIVKSTSVGIAADLWQFEVVRVRLAPPKTAELK
ncbi:MAG: hypothetical protein A3B37_03555 [Candidatus Sungbacteria bacterium RIFCSPLOWO2_01_FULL_59_16]|uniref:DUF4178 domain-containing protein n=1 Tax=Candidatus Sungbacteria bacterium RIFCSPLOWO2_01_FULL_59_16 TaxID=1802280 RepID=A0A1G2LEK2_9BACT|nr:MAG: hypothetical protein A3B37_03555 [Candidatus Sungbacteria bacterium RIFCSPLOWO2_01_FULL_59_16]